VLKEVDALILISSSTIIFPSIDTPGLLHLILFLREIPLAPIYCMNQKRASFAVISWGYDSSIPLPDLHFFAITVGLIANLKIPVRDAAHSRSERRV
jgi:hypothetical protein